MISRAKVFRRVRFCWVETVVTLFFFALVFLVIVFLSRRVIPPHVLLGIVFGGIAMSASALVFSGIILRFISGAELATREKYPLYHEVVDELMKTKWQFPPWFVRPTLYIVHIGKDVPNAMAFGPGFLWFAYVGVTERLYALMTTVREGEELSEQEREFLQRTDPGVLADPERFNRYMQKRKLKGVIAHEFAHIRCKDVGMLSMLGILRGIVASLSSLVKGMSLIPGAAALAAVLKFVGDFCLPLGTSAMQLVREITADALGSLYTGTPEPLIDGLMCLKEEITKLRPEGKTSTNFLEHLFISHPRMEDRFEYLRDLHA